VTVPCSAGVSQRSVRFRCCWRCVETALAVPSHVPGGDVLFFVRVNQVLERLWARSIAKSDRMVGGFGLRTSSDREGSEARRFHYVRAGAYCPGGVMDPVVC
jgi:hypothetical protein